MAPVNSQVTFPHLIPTEHILTSEDGSKRVNLEAYIKTCSNNSFKGFLINQKKELMLLTFKASEVREFLKGMGIKDLNDQKDSSNVFWSSYIKWNTYFLDQMNETNTAVSLEGAIQSGNFLPSYYLDEVSDLFFALIPFDVDIRQEVGLQNNKHKVGVRLYYDLDLVREKVFCYRDQGSFADYLIEVQNRSKGKMTDNLTYIDRIVDIISPLSVHSSSIKSGNEVYVKIFIKNEQFTFKEESIDPNSLLGVFLASQNSTYQELKATDLVSLYSPTIHSFKLKFESSLNQNQDSKIPQEFLDFLDVQMMNAHTNSLLKPGETYSVIYKISRRELLKYRKNQTKLYLQSPLLQKQLGRLTANSEEKEAAAQAAVAAAQKSSQNLQSPSPGGFQYPQSPNHALNTAKNFFSAGMSIMPSMYDGKTSINNQTAQNRGLNAPSVLTSGMDQESAIMWTKSVMNVKAKGARSRVQIDMEEPETQKKTGPQDSLPQDQTDASHPGTLMAYFENYLTSFLTPFNFRLSYGEAFHTDFANTVRWELSAKDVLIAKISVDRSDIREKEDFELSVSFKSYFTSQILVILTEGSVKFNYQDVYNGMGANNDAGNCDEGLGNDMDEMGFVTEDISNQQPRMGVVTPRRQTFKLGINSGQKKIVKLFCTATKSGICEVKQIKADIHDLSGLYLTTLNFAVDFSFMVLPPNSSK